MFRGRLEEAPQEFEYHWASAGTQFSAPDMESIRRNGGSMETVVASVAPGINYHHRGKWFFAAKAQVFGMAKEQSSA